jgi:hypothetical protein
MAALTHIERLTVIFTGIADCKIIAALAYPGIIVYVCSYTRAFPRGSGMALIQTSLRCEMDKSAFLTKVDATIHDEDQKRQTQQRVGESRLDLTKRIVSLIEPILIGYRAELDRRGIQVYFRANEWSLGFELHYAEGGYYGFQLDEKGFSLRFTEDGKGYSGAVCGPPLTENFDVGAFEQFVQATIEEFLTQAPKYGGRHRS